MARDECWDALKEHARQNHKERVAKNPDRIEYAIRQLEAHNIEYVLKNDATGHFHCRRKSDDALVQFWAGTGKILGYTQRGMLEQLKVIFRNRALVDRIRAGKLVRLSDRITGEARE